MRGYDGWVVCGRRLVAQQKMLMHDENKSYGVDLYEVWISTLQRGSVRHLNRIYIDVATHARFY